MTTDISSVSADSADSVDELLSIVDLPDIALDTIASKCGLTNRDQACLSSTCSRMRNVVAFRHVVLSDTAAQLMTMRSRLIAALRGGACETLNYVDSKSVDDISANILDIVATDYPELVARLRHVRVWCVRFAMLPTLYPALQTIRIVNTLTNPMVINDPRIVYGLVLIYNSRHDDSATDKTAYQRLAQMQRAPIMLRAANYLYDDDIFAARDAGLQVEQLCVEGMDLSTAAICALAQITRRSLRNLLPPTSMNCNSALVNNFNANTVTEMSVYGIPAHMVDLEARLAAVVRTGHRQASTPFALQMIESHYVYQTIESFAPVLRLAACGTLTSFDAAFLSVTTWATLFNCATALTSVTMRCLATSGAISLFSVHTPKKLQDLSIYMFEDERGRNESEADNLRGNRIEQNRMDALGARLTELVGLRSVTLGRSHCGRLVTNYDTFVKALTTGLGPAPALARVTTPSASWSRI